MTDTTTNEEAAGSDRATQVRNQAVDDLIADGTIVSAPVEATMRKVPRELFAPGVSLDEVYHRYNGVVTKRDEDGNSISSVSAPQVQRVNVVLADAEGGVPEYAPYDRILVTVGAWDVPPAWVAQLAEGARLLVPLQVRGLSRTISFEHADGCVVSRSSRLFGFVPMQDAGAHQGKLLVIRGGEVIFRFDDEFPVDPSSLEGVLDTPRVEVWSGATIGRFELGDTAQMWLATALPGFCRVVVDRKLNTGLISPPGRQSAAVAVVSGGSFAYVTTRGTAEEMDVEFGVHAFGPDAADLAEEVAEQLRVWGREHRDGPGAQFRVYPVDTPDDQLPEGRVIDKKHSRITISWPAGPHPRREFCSM